MLRSVSMLAAAVLIAVALGSQAAAPASAQQGVAVLSEQPQNEFPSGVSFDLTYSAPEPAKETRLVYHLAPDGTGASAVADCNGAGTISCDYKLTSGRGIFIIPGAEITYHWEITDDAGNTTSTPEKLYVHEDTRFDFSTLKQDNVTLYYHGGTQPQAQAVLDAVTDTLDKVGALEQTQVTFPVKVFLYTTAEEMQPAIAPGGPGRGVQVLGEVVYSDTAMVSADVATLDIARHEVAHIVTREATKGPYEIPALAERGNIRLLAIAPARGPRRGATGGDPRRPRALEQGAELLGLRLERLDGGPVLRTGRLDGEVARGHLRSREVRAAPAHLQGGQHHRQGVPVGLRIRPARLRERLAPVRRACRARGERHGDGGPDGGSASRADVVCSQHVVRERFRRRLLHGDGPAYRGDGGARAHRRRGCHRRRAAPRRLNHRLSVIRPALSHAPDSLIVSSASAADAAFRKDLMPEITHRTIDTNGIKMHIAECGQGPLVLLIHGFPESWYSWRHQLPALAEAGYHAVAPDVRGYGRTDAPQAIEAYSDEGDRRRTSPACSMRSASRRPSSSATTGARPSPGTARSSTRLAIRAVAGLSVPYTPRPPLAPTALFKQMFANNFFYILYFQEPGVAEAELEADVRKSMRLFLFAASGDAPAEATFWQKPKDAKFLDGLPEPEKLPSWLTQADLDYFVAEFERTGFRGGLNRYRNMDRDWEQLPQLEGAKVQQPALFIAGERDGVIAMNPAGIETMKQNVPNLRNVVLLPGAGHWTQQERPAETNAALIEFLKGLP